MENDALAAGVSRIGGLFGTADIRILICYIISSIGEPVPGRLLADILHYEGIANCFEVNDSIAALLKNGQLSLVDECDDTYIATESGKSIAETLKTSLAISVRDRAYTAALKWSRALRMQRKTTLKFQRKTAEHL